MLETQSLKDSRTPEELLVCSPHQKAEEARVSCQQRVEVLTRERYRQVGNTTLLFPQYSLYLGYQKSMPNLRENLLN